MEWLLAAMPCRAMLSYEKQQIKKPELLQQFRLVKTRLS
jgi:hypothetical protein